MHNTELTSVKKTPRLLRAFSLGFKPDRVTVKFNAFGDEQTISMPRSVAERHDPSFSDLLEATFQDARTKGAVGIGEVVGLWIPEVDGFEEFVAPEFARVAPHGKFAFPLLKDIDFSVDHKSKFLVAASGSDTEAVHPIGRWLLRDDTKTPYVETAHYDW